MNWAANVWGRFAAAHHNSGPVEKDDFPMSTVTKIANAGQPQAGTVNWFNECVERSASGDFTEKVIITPGLANVILANNPHNRPLSETKAGGFAKDMAAGRWFYNMETIIIAVTGELNDGQHRLQAIIASNRPQKMLVGFGAERESRVTVDQGMARTAGHYLGMNGAKNANLSASIARMVIAYEASGGTLLRGDSTNAEVVQRATVDGEIVSAAEYAASVQKYARGILTGTFIGAAFYLFAEFDESDAKEYLDDVCIGENIKRGDPAFAVRAALTPMDVTGQRSARRNAMEVLFRGWIAFRQGRKIKTAPIHQVLPALI